MPQIKTLEVPYRESLHTAHDVVEEIFTVPAHRLYNQRTTFDALNTALEDPPKRITIVFDKGAPVVDIELTITKAIAS